ncbi:putative permeases [Clostridium bornimense]|uniref:Putative permeases n=1 Tax=Clostridium bornimense TaxID=1216932 RepID=W6RW63_9CLOT|nr:AEC family transporter [Clostridium bornimense]CDM67874.1 putative permeases [Clostridium bornimense]
MNSFFYSINATIPIFLLMVLGYILKQIGILNDEFVKVSNKFNFTITLPALLFHDISTTNIRESWDLKYVLFCAIVTTICFFSIWILTKILMKDKSMVGAFVQASFRSSAAILGIAFIQNICGTSGMAPLMIIGTVPLYNIYSVIVLTLEGSTSSTENIIDKIKDSLINIAKNPIILAIIAGLIVSLIDIKFPIIIDKTINNLAVMASPLALIAIGAGFEGKKALKKLKPTIIASAIKLILQPAIFLPIAILMGFTDAKLIALVIMLASPTTASCYIMAKNMNNDGVLTSSIVVLTTLLSSITLTFWIFILRSYNLI